MSALGGGFNAMAGLYLRFVGYLNSVWASCWHMGFQLQDLTSCMPRCLVFEFLPTGGLISMMVYLAWMSNVGASTMAPFTSRYLSYSDITRATTEYTVSKFSQLALSQHSLRPSKLWQLGAPWPCICAATCAICQIRCSHHLILGDGSNRLNGSNMLYEHIRDEEQQSRFETVKIWLKVFWSHMISQTLSLVKPPFQELGTSPSMWVAVQCTYTYII